MSVIDIIKNFKDYGFPIEESAVRYVCEVLHLSNNEVTTMPPDEIMRIYPIEGVVRRLICAKYGSLETKPMGEILGELYKTAEDYIEHARLGDASDTATELVKLGDWQGLRILQKVKEVQESRGIPTGYVDFLINHSGLKTRAVLYPKDSNLRDIVSLRNEFSDCTELNAAMENADYSHPLVAFEYVLRVARKSGLTEKNKEFLRAYAVRLGLSDITIGFYRLGEK